MTVTPETTESAEPADRSLSEIGFVGLVLTLLIIFAAMILIGVGVADPYPLGGEQSARWWWLRYPLVFAGLMVCVIVQTITIKNIDDPDFAKEVEKTADAMNAMLFAAALVIVTLSGGTVKNLYNAACGERSIVKAKRAYTILSPKGPRRVGSTTIKYEILEGPLAGKSVSLHWSGTGEHGTGADDGKLALVSLRTSWMGISVLGAYDQAQRVPGDG